MFEGVKAVLFDLDGTVYHGDDIIPGAADAIEHCRGLGKRVFFLTNNSTKTRQQVLERLRGVGVPCEPEEVVTSGYVSALHALQEGIEGLYVCGTDDLRRELEGMGVPHCGAEEAHNLLIGYDPGFDYAKLTEAVRVAMCADRVIACNRERVFRGQGAELFPGCGGMVAPIEWCSGRAPDFVVGKPNTLLLKVLCREFGYGPGDVLMVGDTYESDVAMADAFGCASVLVGEHEDVVCVAEINGITTLLS